MTFYSMAPMAISGVCTWQPVLTDHQAMTFDSLRRVSGCEVVSYVLNDDNEDRKLQGWRFSEYKDLVIKKIPTRFRFIFFWKQIRSNMNAVHIFCSTFEKIDLFLCLLIALTLNVKVYLITEPYSTEAVGYLKDEGSVSARSKVLLRPLLYSFYCFLLRGRIRGIFTISELAAVQFMKAGVESSLIYPFGYFVNANADSIDRDGSNGVLRLVFVGSLIKRKGLDILIEAVSAMRKDGFEVSLDVYGHGDVSVFDLHGEGVQYCGAIEFGRTQDCIRNFSFLVLPSRFDGWGVVVNEAILSGTPVVCSDKVGASVLVNDGKLGFVFRSGDVDDLRRVLSKIHNFRSIEVEFRSSAKNFRSRISPERAAAYMWDVFSGREVLRNGPWNQWREGGE